ncbi:MAG: PglZ domain-containing protein [Actinomycetota bacterium]
MTASTDLRSFLAARLKEKCVRHHLVVWDDPAGQYADVAEQVAPQGWGFERYAGSWWELRRRVEPGFSAVTPPRLVIYLPTAPPAADPLEELRQSSGGFKRLLPKLIKDALEGELSAARINELAKKCSTLTAAQEALTGSNELDPLLVLTLGVHDPGAALAAALDGRSDLSEPVRQALALLVLDHLGLADLEGDGAAISGQIVRHLLVGTLAGLLGDRAFVPFAASWQALSVPQYRRVAELVERMSGPGTMDQWGELTDRAAAELGLRELSWDDRLAGCDIARVIDELSFDQAVRLLEHNPSAAEALAARRAEGSRWLVRWRDPWSTRALADFEAVRSVARLVRKLAEYPLPPAGGLSGVYEWYSQGAWRVDRAYRLMEASRFGLSRKGLDKAYISARAAYVEWLDLTLSAANSAAVTGAETGLPAQAGIHGRYIEGHRKVALIIVDAMRLEIGHRLAEVLSSATVKPEVEAAAAAVPTITVVGMANLLPGAVDGLAFQRQENGLTVLVGGHQVRTVADRTSAYRKAADRVQDHPLGEWLGLGDDLLRNRVENSDLMVVRSQEIDAAGENGLATMRWSQIDSTVDALAILIGRLAAAGVLRVVVTADHGFLALGRPLDPSRVLPPPSGSGKVEHGRAWVGQLATVPDGCTALTLADFGVLSSDSLVVPDGMTVFGSSGAGFFHGGISPQEAIVPVIVVDLENSDRPGSEFLTVQVEIPGGKVAAEAFSARVSLAGSLFALDVSVRITATYPSGETVARLVPGGAVDPHTGTVRLDPNADSILTFLVSRDLNKGQTLDVNVIDASNGRRLALAQATVARDLRPEGDW